MEKIDQLKAIKLDTLPAEIAILVKEYLDSYQEKKNQALFLQKTEKSLNDLLEIVGALGAGTLADKKGDSTNKDPQKETLITFDDGFQFKEVDKKEGLKLFKQGQAIYAINLKEQTERLIETEADFKDFDLFGVEFKEEKKEKATSPKKKAISKPQLEKETVDQKTKELQEKLSKCLNKKAEKQTAIKKAKAAQHSSANKPHADKPKDFKTKLTDLLIKVTKLIIKEDDVTDKKDLKKRITDAYHLFLTPSGVKSSKRALANLSKELDVILDKNETLDHSQLIKEWKRAIPNQAELKKVALKAYQQKGINEDIKEIKSLIAYAMSLYPDNKKMAFKDLKNSAEKKGWDLQKIVPVKIFSEMKTLNIL